LNGIIAEKITLRMIRKKQVVVVGSSISLPAFGRVEIVVRGGKKCLN
jgi:hypothetical protein